ncbi:uncharacterized protein LOC141848102 [Curcuma longa]|uniref:uncharacterized protein LOC141848102 n=1 Tax=Curcuma longa TaxID=136217 RepID=UPI003D9EEA8A
MLSGGGADLPASRLQIEIHDDDLCSRLLSKHDSAGNPSFRVLYYGVASGAVPFLWESQPGTPKHTSSAAALPPLTPPPSYFNRTGSKPVDEKPSKSRFIHAVLPKLSFRKVHISPSSSLSPSHSSAGRSSNARTPPYFSHQDSDDENGVPPFSNLCFSIRGRRPDVPVKNALLAMVRRGSTRGGVH